MPRSQNGWSASADLELRPLVVGGVSFVPGIRDDDAVATVLGYVLAQFHERVESLHNPGCWGFSYRENRNDPNSLSNHSSGTAVDANAPQHPNGVPTLNTFTVAEVTEIHKILAEVDHVVRWGGDYTGTPDAMHFEINADRTAVVRVAAQLEDDMFSDKDSTTLAHVAAQVDKILEVSKARDKRLRDLVKRKFKATDADLDEIFAAVED